MPNIIKERDIQKGILDYLKLKGIFCWKNSTVGIAKLNGSFIPAQMTGVSDIIGLLPDGRFLAIEVKRKGNRTTFNQDVFLDNVRRNKGLAIIAFSLDDVTKEI